MTKTDGGSLNAVTLIELCCPCVSQLQRKPVWDQSLSIFGSLAIGLFNGVFDRPSVSINGVVPRGGRLGLVDRLRFLCDGVIGETRSLRRAAFR
ncbi:MAG: hypothetical protein R3C49_26230 [Planctomycetaceae bacterium]